MTDIHRTQPPAQDGATPISCSAEQAMDQALDWLILLEN
ncbi:glycerol-3-phosphate ABC transporter substrate-binding protein, partial [Bacillus thuringiensis]